MSPLLRRKLDPGMVTIDTDSAPRVIHFGEDFLEEDLPVGTRVIYPKPPIQGLPNPRAAVRYALNHPLGCEPLHAQLRPGMKVTVAVDDISLPLPPMLPPDVRQTVLEVVLEMLSDHGVDDIHLIVANSLHRKLTESEMRRMVGSKIHREFNPDRYYCHDAEDADGLVTLGETDHGELLRINRRAAESGDQRAFLSLAQQIYGLGHGKGGDEFDKRSDLEVRTRAGQGTRVHICLANSTQEREG